MGSSSKKKKEKQKDFAKPKLKVGKTKPKADNHTSTSFRSKAIVVGHQSLNTAAPTLQTQLKHNLTLLNHHAYSTRRDSLAHIASVLSSSPASNPPISYSILLPALAPLTLDSAAPVRTQLLTLLTSLTKPKDLRQDAIIPVDAVRMHTPRFLLYVHSAMTHISADIRGDSTNFLSWLLDVVGEDAVRGAKGWGKTLKCWMVLLGWESGKSGPGIRTSSIEFSDPGKNKKASLQHLIVLKKFLSVGMLENETPLSHYDIRMADLLRPHQYTESHLMPKTSNIYAHLSLFATGGVMENVNEEDAEGSAEDFDSRRRIVNNVFEGNIRAGLHTRLQEGGEIGRLAGGLLKVMDKALKADRLDTH
ncbi:rRNA processing protein [Orbilia ellipsospora]|uniref:Pre-rRNA-processing protein n=1 Tax=Orbilia ellipsospora TaxID=2528407 RepID=A0AAV9XPZ2_9PEZI